MRIVHNAMEAARDADILYTDSWVSYHIDASEKEDRIKLFSKIFFSFLIAMNLYGLIY